MILFWKFRRFKKLKKKLRIEILFLIAFIILLYSSFCNADDKKNIELKRLKIFRFGIMKSTFIGKNILDAKAAFEIWTQNYIKENKNLNVKVETAIFEDIESVKNAIRKNEIEFLNINSLEYLKMSLENILQGFLVNTIKNFPEKSPQDELLILTLKKSGIKNIIDLKGKKILVQTGKWGEIPAVWLKTLLTENNIFFSEEKILAFEKVSQAVYQVYFNQADACVVSSASFKLIRELNPNIGASLNIISQSDEFLPFIFCYTKNADTELTDIVRKSVLTFDKSSYGKQILTLFQTDKIIPFENLYLNNIRRLYDKYNKIIIKNEK